MKSAPLLLALDLSTPVGSVAVGREGEVLAGRYLLERGAHGAMLLPSVAEVLEEVGVSSRELDGVLVGSGPGSFTGVRVAAATARGLAAGLSIPVWTRSSLAAAAVSDGVEMPAEIAAGPDWERAGIRAGEKGDPRYVLFDARADRVYAACYRLSGGRFDAVFPPKAETIEGILGSEIPEGVLFCGCGALRHADRLREAGFRVLSPPIGIPTAAGLLRLQELDPGTAPASLNGHWEPEYLRGAWGGKPGVEAGAAS
jgi:tRNA threonylcarbamoyladenosine biosynthesis protein TsaB